MAKKNVFVVKHDDGWAVKKEGADRASFIEPTQAKAIDRGRELAKGEKSELRIQGRDGKFRDSDSYGNDPNPPKDKKH